MAKRKTALRDGCSAGSGERRPLRSPSRGFDVTLVARGRAGLEVRRGRSRRTAGGPLSCRLT